MQMQQSGDSESDSPQYICALKSNPLKNKIDFILLHFN